MQWLTKAVNETEEWFYQLKGDMLLRLVENGAIRDMTLKEGEMFLVPGRHDMSHFSSSSVSDKRNQGTLLTALSAMQTPMD